MFTVTSVVRVGLSGLVRDDSMLVKEMLVSPKREIRKVVFRLSRKRAMATIRARDQRNNAKLEEGERVPSVLQRVGRT